MTMSDQHPQRSMNSTLIICH